MEFKSIISGKDLEPSDPKERNKNWQITTACHVLFCVLILFVCVYIYPNFLRIEPVEKHPLYDLMLYHQKTSDMLAFSIGGCAAMFTPISIICLMLTLDTNPISDY